MATNDTENSADSNATDNSVFFRGASNLKEMDVGLNAACLVLLCVLV